MTSDKPNNDIDWKNKLGDLEGLAGEKFNKEAFWEKLHSRLQKKPKSKKIIWYWMAAACLFFALFISFFVSNKIGNVLVKDNLTEKKINSLSTRDNRKINRDTSSIIYSLSVKTKSPVTLTKERNKIISHKILSAEITQDKKEEIAIKEINTKAVMPVDTTISIVANLPEKKKLKVVHVNELGDPVSESPNIARYNEQHSFQFKIMNQEVYTRSSSAVTQKGFKIFTTKNLTN
ncbi:MAG TPA: hypothetical protein VLM16_06060 [Ginsengibacter sp.]|nr:hypothetical protein [Ginsengibacter sp.]